jgi:NADPH2:quinone reductase
MVQGLTALYAARRYNLKGKAVLVTAAAGGVGSLLVQLTKLAGAEKVIAAASSSEKLELARSLGADDVVNYSTGRWLDLVKDLTNGRGVDIAYDFVGGQVSSDCLNVLKRDGTLLFGALGRMTLGRPELEEMASNNQSISGFALLPLITPRTLSADLTELFGLVLAGKLQVVIGGTYPLNKVAEAHRRMDNRGSRGKVILIP